MAVFDRGISFPMGYTDGAQVCLPTTRMLSEHGYEVDSFHEYHWPAQLAPNGEKVMEAALRGVRDKGIIANEG